MVQNDKKVYLLHSISQEPYIIWLSFMVQMCKIIISAGVFFNFKILILQVARGWKGKKCCLSYSVSQELYIIWLWFSVHICEMMISPASFFILQNFDFGGFVGGKRAKNDLKLPISVCFALYLRNCRSYHQDFDNDIYRCFSLFFLKKYNNVNGKINLFFIGQLQQFFNNYLFFKFLYKW